MFEFLEGPITKESGTLTRQLTPDECPWLDRTLTKGMIIFKYIGDDFGCISPKGVAVCSEPNELPFYEVPEDAVEWDQ